MFQRQCPTENPGHYQFMENFNLALAESAHFQTHIKGSAGSLYYISYYYIYIIINYNI